MKVMATGMIAVDHFPLKTASGYSRVVRRESLSPKNSLPTVCKIASNSTQYRFVLKTARKTVKYIYIYIYIYIHTYIYILMPQNFPG